MKNIIAFALLFVLSVTDFGQKITIQTGKEKPKVASKVSKVQKEKPKTVKTTAKIPVKTPSKTPLKAQKIKPKAKKTAQETPKQEITTIKAKTEDGKDILLKADGTWAYKTPEPMPKPTPTATPAPIAKATPAKETIPKLIVKETPSPVVKPSPAAKTKPAPTPSKCDLALTNAPLIRGLRLGMSRTQADEIIPTDRVTVIGSSDIVSYPQFSNARGFENVYQISARFYEDKLTALEIVYDADEVKWKNAREFAESLSASLNLSPVFWKYNAKNASSAEMQCKEFAIKIDSTANEISIQKITDAEKTAQDTPNQKKIFKP